MAKDDGLPHPGMGQDEKDRRGLKALRDAERDRWAPDEELDGYSKSELLDEASVRRVALRPDQIRSKDAILKAVREVDPDAGKRKAKAKDAAEPKGADEPKGVHGGPTPPQSEAERQATDAAQVVAPTDTEPGEDDPHRTPERGDS